MPHSTKHHLMQRNGIWQFRMVINGKDRWKTTRTRDFDKAVKVRDSFLRDIESWLAAKAEREGMLNSLIKGE